MMPGLPGMGMDPLAAFAALAQGQGQPPQPVPAEADVLTRALEYAQQQQARLGPAPQMDPSAQAQGLSAQRQMEMADALMGQGYIPNSGPLGAIAQVFSAYSGRKQGKKAEESLADALAREAEQQRAAAGYEGQRKAFEEGPGKIMARAEQAKALGLDGAAAQEFVLTGKMPRAGSGGPTSLQEFKAAQENPEFAAFLEKRDRSRGTNVTVGGGGYSVLSAEEATALGLPEGTVAQRDSKGKISILQPAPKPTPAPGSKPLTPDQGTKAALFENAARAARQWNDLVVGPKGQYNDLVARSPQAQTLLRQAISAKLRAESGATITPQEIDNEMERYMGGFFTGALKSDATASRQAQTLLDDLQTQLDAFGEQGRQSFERATARPAPAAAEAPQIRIRSVRPASP